MDRLERYCDSETVIRQSLFAWQAEIWTALPGYVISFDPNEITVSVQVTYLFSKLNQDGTTENVKMTPLIHCPIIAPRGGGMTLTFPIKPNDECLVIFACRCIDGWWRDGGVQPPTEYRLHDLSDGFALIGPFSQAQKISSWNTQAAELRTDDGQAFVQLDPTSKKITAQTQSVMAQLDPGSNQITLHTSGTVLVDAPVAEFTGNVQVDGNLIVGGEVTGVNGANQVTLSGHIHLNTSPGIGTSGPPEPGI